MGLLEAINHPRDLDEYSAEQLLDLAAEIRVFLVDKVSKTGGHLGPNLGVVELSIGLHRVFDSPNDLILWDIGHQSYVHKILTGRRASFNTLRQAGGLSGYPCRAESPHDVIENSHASTALSYADGIAKAWALQGDLAHSGQDGGARHVVAVVGDGALTGGMAWEALNNIADSDRQVIIVVNDNERSYAPTIGGLAHHLSTLRTTGGYEQFLGWGKRLLNRTPLVGRSAYETLHGLKKGVKDIVAPQGMFEDLGLKYVGPVDGHDLDALEFALHRAKVFPGPVIVHTITQKGRGYRPAELDEADCLHGVGVIDPDTGRSVVAGAPSWTSVFSSELVTLGHKDERIVAITAAMAGPTGLNDFAAEFPDRIFDVGIAEQHGVTSAAGMAFAGLHPVVAMYSTFLSRAFDQLLMDAALHKAPITFVLDRAGVTGDDGASHHGMWDMSILGVVPGVRVAAPRDGTRLRELLAAAVAITDGPTVVRFPKGALPDDMAAVATVDGMDVLHQAGRCDVLVVAVGAMAQLGVEVAVRAAAQDVGVTVVDPRWVKPLPTGLAELAANFDLIVTIEDNTRAGGIGSAVSQNLRDAGVDVQVRDIGLPADFLDHGKRSEILATVGLCAQDITRSIVETVANVHGDRALRLAVAPVYLSARDLSEADERFQPNG